MVDRFWNNHLVARRTLYYWDTKPNWFNLMPDENADYYLLRREIILYNNGKLSRHWKCLFVDTTPTTQYCNLVTGSATMSAEKKESLTQVGFLRIVARHTSIIIEDWTKLIWFNFQHLCRLPFNTKTYYIHQGLYLLWSWIYFQWKSTDCDIKNWWCWKTPG